MKDERTQETRCPWSEEPQTKPGTPKAKTMAESSGRIVTGPGVYSDVFHEMGPLVIRDSKY